MRFNYNTVRYLQQNSAVLIKDDYKITHIDFNKMIAFVNKVSTYRKRNGKECKVVHHFEKAIIFSNSDVCFITKKEVYISDDWSVADRVDVTRVYKVPLLKKESYERIVKEYISRYVRYK